MIAQTAPYIVTMNTSYYSPTALDNLFNEAIVKLGIGGYVSTAEILRYFNPLTAEKFAEIAYATDLMSSMFSDPDEVTNAANIEGVIEQNQFHLKPCFTQLMEMFSARFGSIAKLTFE